MRVAQLKREGESGRSAEPSVAPRLPRGERNPRAPELPGEGLANTATTQPAREKATDQLCSVSHPRPHIIPFSSPAQLQRLGADFSAR